MRASNSLCVRALQPEKDITLDPRFATLCGYTQQELERVFGAYLDGVDLEQIRHWYNGYNFLGERVYNPFDVLLYLDTRLLRPHWFESGTPTFLIDLMRRRGFDAPQLDAFVNRSRPGPSLPLASLQCDRRRSAGLPGGVGERCAHPSRGRT